MSKQYRVAIVGATGAVGQQMLSILAERNFPISEAYALASARSAGKKVKLGNQELIIEDLATFDFTKADIALFSAGGNISAEFAPKAAAANCVVIDNTSHFRYEDDIPLIVPEVNLNALGQYKKRNIIANPNCSTIQMLVALKPIYDAVGITRINVATYQAVSGSGQSAINELHSQVSAMENNQPVEASVYPVQIAYNAIPQVDVFLENGYTKEEMKMVWETQKIFEDKSIQVNPTAVRIPVVFGHSEAINIETKQKITAEQARELLSKFPGIKLVDQREPGGYPTPITHGAGTDAVYVGRIREDISHPKGLSLWVVADNVRKGAALNSVQIAERLIEDYL